MSLSVFTPPPPVRVRSYAGSRDLNMWVVDMGTTLPPIDNFRPRDYCLIEETGDIYQLGRVEGVMGWQLIANIKGPAGDGELDPGELEELSDGILDELEPPVDLTVLFENALV